MDIVIRSRMRHLWVARLAVVPLLLGLWLLRRMRVDVLDERGILLDRIKLRPNLVLDFNEDGKDTLEEGLRRVLHNLSGNTPSAEPPLQRP